MNKLKAIILLLFVNLIWGTTFSVVKKALNSVKVSDIIFLRFLIGIIVLIPFLYFKKIKSFDRFTIIGGSIAGLFLAGGYFFQTLGLKYTGATKSAFVTGLYVITVPFFSYMILKKRPAAKNIYGLIIATLGTILLFLESDISLKLNTGDILTIFCALCFGVQIVILSKFIRKNNFLEFTLIQLIIVCILAFIFSFNHIFEVDILNTALWKVLFVVGFLGTGFCFLGQSISQNSLSADEAAVIYTSEPLFGGIAGFLFLNEILQPFQILGGILIITGILVSEVNFKRLLRLSR
ncbi:MAG: hypothetical protein C0601_02250 [Candidatus Muiribacterium halophilum]|uniref:EamA domain-containing protein n=1 Tax=Muiribacterium halophilum TaxID=2053465 RepID=A0A2N5ZKZ6_MUIH1|nr:MAG: hypothetical protein C0601_02250 [Candidatus Muirbacterium halophilum]